MNQATDNGSRRTIGRVLGHAAAVLLFTAAIIQPKVANAAHGDRGRFSSDEVERLNARRGTRRRSEPFRQQATLLAGKCQAVEGSAVLASTGANTPGTIFLRLRHGGQNDHATVPCYRALRDMPPPPILRFNLWSVGRGSTHRPFRAPLR